jgi:hypothetical protein
VEETVTTPADPPPVPVEPGTPEAAERLRAALEDHETDRRQER